MDSDVANADSHLHVEFYTNDRKPYEGVPFVRIMVPGDKTNIIDQPVKESHKQRFPRQWLYFQMQANGSQAIGTPLQDWSHDRPDDLSPNQLAELGILKFQTAEQVATMSDSQAQKVGMSGIPLREKARAYIASKNQKASSSELDATKAELEALKAQVAELMASKPRVGRPPKSAEA